MSNRHRAVLLALAAAVLVAAALLAGGSTDEDADDTPPATATSTAASTTTVRREPTATTDATPEPETVVVRDGEPVGGIAKLSFDKGETIRFVVRSDAPDEVHLHGYDVRRDVGPDRPARFRVEASIDGRFEVELEATHTPIAEVRVQP